MLYIKEISEIEEIFYNKYPKWLNYIIFAIKYVFCVITVKNENNCYIPYKKITNRLYMKLIITMLSKRREIIVLSKPLLKNELFMKEVREKNIEYVDGHNLFDYNILNILQYIAKVRKKDITDIEVTVLINNMSENNIAIIRYLATNVKRLNIVSSNFEKFRKIENELQEELGISILITNSKRKSLLKAKIIVNIDFNEELLELYQINRDAIIIQKQKQNINKKSFNGINVIDYEINFDIEGKSEFYKEFENKDLLMSMIDIDKIYKDIVEQLDKYKVKVVGLIGNKGMISTIEFEQEIYY